MLFKIKRITVLTGHGTDKVVLHTDLPKAIVSNPHDDETCVSLEASRGTGETYANANFPGVSVEVIHTRG